MKVPDSVSFTASGSVSLLAILFGSGITVYVVDELFIAIVQFPGSPYAIFSLTTTASADWLSENDAKQYEACDPLV